MQKYCKIIVVLLIFFIIIISVNAGDIIINDEKKNDILINIHKENKKQIEWITTFGGSNRDVAYAFEKAQDDTYIIIGD